MAKTLHQELLIRNVLHADETPADSVESKDLKSGATAPLDLCQRRVHRLRIGTVRLLVAVHQIFHH